MKNWAKLQNHVNWQIDTVNEARESTEGFIRQTDSLLAQVNGPDQVVKGIAKLLKPDNGTSVIEKAVAFEYGVSTEPDLSLPQLLADLDSLKTKIITFKFKDAALLKDQPQLLATLIEFDKRVSDFIAAVKAIDRSSDIGKTFLLYQGWLKSWRRQFLSIDKDAFTLAPYEVTCSFAFSGNKENKVELFRRDRLSDAATQVSHVDITVVCSAPVSVSGGFGFSSIHESDFVFVQSTKSGVDAMGKPTETVINKFGLKNSSAFRVLPLLLVNTRVWEPSDVFALHASVGAAVDIKTGQAGTDVEYVVGPSFSFKRSLFVTPALHVGRIPSLAGGFSLGQEVPTGVSQPPLTKTWGRGFALTFTYFIR